MNFFKTYSFLVFLVLCGCNRHEEKRENKLIKRIVYAIPFEEPVKPLIPKDTSYLETVFATYGLVDIQKLDSTIKVDLKYAGSNNFLGRDFYDGLNRAYFPCEVAQRICNAQYYLKKFNPSYSLVILDAARPLHVQQMMWDSLKMPPDMKFNYLAPPYTISLHNYGCAVDLTIIDLSKDSLLNMGSEFDHFGKLSEPVYEWQFLKSGELTQQAFENRKLLRRVMQTAKLNPINSEWWHFNFCSKEYAASAFKLIK
ncbi:MAG: M15 family metallopeptidase [Bacteroidia bacterium]